MKSALHLQAMRSVLDEVAAERRRQHDRFGEQNMPDGTGDNGVLTAECLIGFPDILADDVRDATHRAAHDGRCTYAHILAEEFFEAFAETDPARLRAELVQVAAVAVQWIEAIDRRAKATAKETT